MWVIKRAATSSLEDVAAMLKTNLQGRLRNTRLTMSHCMQPVFEAIINSIHAVDDIPNRQTGKIALKVIREPQQMLSLDKPRRGTAPLENITDFEIVDNGIGFTAKNMDSFCTLDSQLKASMGGRGMGRLLWLKAFDSASVQSRYADGPGMVQERTFDFNPTDGVLGGEPKAGAGDSLTVVRLHGFKAEYRRQAPKTALAIANDLLEHCLFYFVRSGGAPEIVVSDGDEEIDLRRLFEDYMLTSSKDENIDVGGRSFDLMHIKLKSSAQQRPFIAWCASDRVVDETFIDGKIPGLHGRIRDEDGDFVYACYLTSPYLDDNVRPERIAFDIPENNDELLAALGPSKTDIENAVLASIRNYLGEYLRGIREAARKRIDRYVSYKAVRYRPILRHISDEELFVDPEISDKDLDVHLHKRWYELEHKVITEAQELLRVGEETKEQYQVRLADFIEKIDDIKRSDLATYVAHP
jgi:hypothetical protein